MQPRQRQGHQPTPPPLSPYGSANAVNPPTRTCRAILCLALEPTMPGLPFRIIAAQPGMNSQQVSSYWIRISCSSSMTLFEAWATSRRSTAMSRPLDCSPYQHPPKNGVCPLTHINQADYLRDLQERQRKHLDSLEPKIAFRPCLHDQCPRCHGTGRSAQGMCIHGIACSCPKCAATC